MDDKKNNVSAAYRNRVVGILFTLILAFYLIINSINPVYNVLTQNPKALYWSILFQLEQTNSDGVTPEKFKAVVKGIDKYLHYVKLVDNKIADYIWIDIYGLTVKSLDLYKPVPDFPAVKLTNSQLSFYESDDVDIDQYANILLDFKRYLEKKNIAFVYVQEPHKNYKYQQTVPPGITDYNNRIFDRFIQKIESSVPVIDMRDYFKQRPEKHYELFYPGDSHWKPEYAFITSQQIMKYFHDNYSCVIERNINDLNNYELVVTDKKCNEISIRLGDFYFNFDKERQYYLAPRFDTSITITSDPVNLEIINYDAIDYKGPYNPRLLCQFRPGMSVRNSNAANNKKIMILGDSFSPPVMSFLTLNFTELEYHALNYFDGNIFDVIEEFNPDIIVLLLTARILDIQISGKPTPNTQRYFDILTPPMEKDSRQE